MGPTERPSIAVDRYFGYRDVFVSHDYLMGKEWVITSKIYEIDAYQTMQDIIVGGKIPQAIVCVNDGVALGAYRAIVEADLKIPDDIALAGYGNTLSTDLLPVPLTTIEQPAGQLGEKAISLLLDEIESDAEPKDIVLKTNIILRDSTHKYTHFYNSDTIQMQTTKNITG
jgi:DNA-binding LacI/PurR family transcriptional regulator